MEKYDRAGQATDANIIRRMRIAFRLTMAMGTHLKIVILNAFPRHVKRMQLSVELYVHCLSCLTST